MTYPSSPRALGFLGGASAIGLMLGGQAAEAHGIAQGGIASGMLHPLLGVDHLLLLAGVGTTAAAISPRLLDWAMAGALGGGLYGVFGGSLPAQELLAALAVSVLGLLVLLKPRQGWCGALVAAAVAIHAMLHGIEAPSSSAGALWWAGAALASTAIVGGSYLVVRRLPAAAVRGVGLVLAVMGAGLVLGSLGAALA